jgi:peptidyl-prolyl cis-trans isomerase D
MQIIQNIREKGAAIVIGVIALSLIGFILMDANLGSQRSAASASEEIGSVNGEAIGNDEFNRKIQSIEAQYGGRASGAQVYQIRQNAWDQLTSEKIAFAAFDKLGLQFTGKELAATIFSEDAPQSLKQAFTDPKTGQYDLAKVQQWWKDAKKFKGDQRDAVDAQVIEPIKIQSLATRYSSLLSAAGYYPTWMREKEEAEASNFATISYVAVPYSTIADSTVKVSDAEIIEYMSKRKDQYKQDGGRQIAYVGFSINPTSADSLATLKSVAELKANFAADTNAKIFVARNMSNKNFTDAYELKSKMTMAVKDSIAATAVNSVYGPYLDGKDYVLAKVLGSRTLPDSVKCRHILVGTVNPQTGQPTLADSLAKKRIDSIELAIKAGEDFNKMVLQYSDDQGSKDKKGEYDYSSAQFAQLTRLFAETIFYGNTGDKKVVKTEFGYHYIEVMSQKNFEPAYKIAYMAKEVVASEETINAASGKANKLSGEAKDIKTFDAYVAKNNLQKMEYPMLVKENDYQIGGLQDARQLVKWAFESKLGAVSEPMNIGDQFVVGCVTGVVAKGLPDAKTARPNVEYLVRNEKKATQIKAKLKTATTLEAAATASQQQVQLAGTDSSLVFTTSTINGLGNEPKVVGASFNKQNASKISEPIAGNNGVYVIKVNATGTKPAATPAEAASKAADRARALAQQIGGGWFEGLRSQADIKDDRSKTN